MGPSLLSRFLGGVDGSAIYVAEMCEVAGVRLMAKGVVEITITERGRALATRVEVDGAAASAKPSTRRDTGRYCKGPDGGGLRRVFLCGFCGRL